MWLTLTPNAPHTEESTRGQDEDDKGADNDDGQNTPASPPTPTPLTHSKLPENEDEDYLYPILKEICLKVRVRVRSSTASSTVCPPMFHSFRQVMVSDPHTRAKFEESCMKRCLNRLDREKKLKQFSFFDRCLRWQQALALDQRGSRSLTWRKEILKNMLDTTKMLAKSNLETVTVVHKSRAPVDNEMFPGSKDSGK